MWNDETEALRLRIARLSNQELLEMVTLDYEQYRKEALDYAWAEVGRRGLKIEPVTFTGTLEEEARAELDAADSEHESETDNSESSTPPTEFEQEAGYASQVEFKVFSGMRTSWDELFSEAAAFATGVGSFRLISISHSSGDEKVVTVWYWA